MKLTIPNVRILLAAGLTVAAIPQQSEAGRLLVIERVEVRPTKEGGETAWDVGGGAPDLKVSVERTSAPAGEKHITAPRKNVYQADFNRTALEVEANDELKFQVLDEDVGHDDEVGTISRQISAEELRSGKLELSFGQVTKLILRFER
jgi:hypothetical protein